MRNDAGLKHFTIVRLAHFLPLTQLLTVLPDLIIFW
jgi:hypothetical protein